MSVSVQIDECDNSFFERDDSSQVFYKINRNFIETVDFKNLTPKLMVSNPSSKILKISKCPSFETVLKSLGTVQLSVDNRVFLLVLEFQEELNAPTEAELKTFSMNFCNLRPCLLLFNSVTARECKVFVKNSGEKIFQDLSTFDSNEPLDIGTLKKILEIHGQCDGNIETWKLSEISEKTEWSKRVAGSALLIRVLNLFEGGCSRTVPWLTDSSVKKDCWDSYLAFVDAPFGYEAAFDQAWLDRKFDMLERFISRDSPFPKNFDINKIKTDCTSENFRKILKQRQTLHESIAEQKLEEVYTILTEMDSGGQIKFAFNEFNHSAMATALQNFSVDIYVLLLQENMKFCGKCYDLMWKLPETTREVIKHYNKKYFKPLTEVPNMHKLFSKCYLATGHSDLDLYSEKINSYLWNLEAVPETSQLFRLLEKSWGLKIAFDFNHNHTGLMVPDKRLFSVPWKTQWNPSGLCCPSETIYVAAKSGDGPTKGTLAHEIAHLAFQLTYGNSFLPYLKFDDRRKKEYDDAMKECRKVLKKKDIVKTEIVNAAFQNYPSNELGRELIVRVPQILVLHSHSDIEAVKAKYPKLFAFYSNYIPADIDAALDRKFDIEVDRSFAQSVDFSEVSAEWVASKKSDDLKILKIRNCLKIDAVASLLQRVKVSSLSNLFVLVLEMSGTFERASITEINRFINVFDDRPLVLQIRAPNGRKAIYVRDYNSTRFFDGFRDLALVRIAEPRMSELKLMLEMYGCFDGDILSARMCSINKDSAASLTMASSLLCLRFMNLFNGGATRIMPWIDANYVLGQWILRSLEFIIFYIAMCVVVLIALHYLYSDFVLVFCLFVLLKAMILVLFCRDSFKAAIEAVVRLCSPEFWFARREIKNSLSKKVQSNSNDASV